MPWPCSIPSSWRITTPPSAVERFLAINTRDADGFLLLGRSLYGAGRPEEAIAAFDRVIEFSAVEEKRRQAAENKKRILDELYGG